MSNIWFCSDLHFGHVNIQNFRKEVQSESDNVEIISSDWNTFVTKRDIVYVLGDACFTEERLSVFKQLPGKKYLVRGNHDELPTLKYLEVFEEVYGIVKYKEFWLSHAPIHSDELRGRKNLHGHVHYQSVMEPFNPTYHTFQKKDKRYINCCPENLWPNYGRSLISLNEVRKLAGA